MKKPVPHPKRVPSESHPHTTHWATDIYTHRQKITFFNPKHSHDMKNAPILTFNLTLAAP